MATRYNFRCSSCGEEFDRTDIDCPYCGSYESHDTIYEIELVAELEKEREWREKAEAVVRYSPFDPRILALDDAGYVKIPSPQRVRDILAERDMLRKALESLVRCHASGGFVEPDEDVLTQARAALALKKGDES